MQPMVIKPNTNNSLTATAARWGSDEIPAHRLWPRFKIGNFLGVYCYVA
uniref:Uncharacterized protein n=1 Tax=Rhizophora mucronata TaxID=61149 RepID=A0A2P2PQ57_RHIMU